MDCPTIQCFNCSDIFEYGLAKKLNYVLDPNYKRTYIKVKSNNKNETVDIHCPKCSEILSVVFLPESVSRKIKFNIVKY